MARSLCVWSLYLVVTASALSLTELLKSRSELSVWHRLIQPQWDALDRLTNITFLAPNNGAMSEYFNTPQVTGCASADPAIVQALVSFHTLQQEYDSFPGGSVFTTGLTGDPYAASITNETWLFSLLASDSNSPAANVTSLVSGLNTHSNILSLPISFSGGVVYIIDTVLQLPANTSITLVAAGYTAFAGAIRHTFTEDIANTKGVNINLPTDEAFQEIGSALLNMTADETRTMILYHMQNQSIWASDGNLDGPSATLAGINLTDTNINDTVSYTNNALVDNSAYFYSSDSGNIWVMDKVLNPRNTTAPLGSVAWPNPSKVAYVPFASDAPHFAPTQCAKPVWLDSVLYASRIKRDRAIIGVVVGLVLAVGLIATRVIFSRRKNKRVAGPHQEIDGMETFGRPELRGYSHVPSELDADLKHELENAENQVFELPAESDTRPELESRLPRLELATHKSETHDLVSPLSPEAERLLILNQQFEPSKAIALSPS